MMSSRKFPINIAPELKAELMAIFTNRVSLVRHDDDEIIPTCVQQLVTWARGQIGLKDTINEFTLRGSHHNRLDGSLIDPAEPGTVGRVILNFNAKEIYNVMESGVGAYLQARDRKTSGLEQTKKIRIPPLQTDEQLLLEADEAFFVVPPRCNTTLFHVTKNPNRVLPGRKGIAHIRPRNYDRLTIVIDYRFQPSPEEMKKFMDGMKFDIGDDGTAEAYDIEIPTGPTELEKQINAAEPVS